jgi:tetratricopeptide (TPR) repeat protein
MDYPAEIMRHVLQLISAISYLDQGKFEQAKLLAAQAGGTAIGELGARQQSLVSRCAILERENDSDRFSACLRELTKLDMLEFEEGNIPRRYWPSANLAFIGIVAARNGHHAEAKAIFDTIHSHALQSGVYPIETYASILEAEILMGEGQYDDAVPMLQSLVTERSLFQAHESLARAYQLAGDTASAINEYVWLTENRGQAFAQQVSRGFGNAFHVLDWVFAHASLGRLYEEAGMPAEALAAYTALLEHWSNADDGMRIVELSRRRVDALNSQTQGASQ